MLKDINIVKSFDIYLGVLITLFGIIGFARIVLDEPSKTSRFKLALIILSSSICYALTYVYLEGTLKTLVVCIINILTFKYVFKIDYPKAMFLTLMYVILLIIPDALTLIFLTKILNISKQVCYEVYASGVLSSTMICILFLGLTMIVKKPLRRLINYKLENSKKIIIFSILTFLCIAIIFYNAFGNIEFNTNLIISIFTMIIFVVILISLMKQMYENSNLTKKYEQVLEFMITYEDEVEKQRVLRHETKNAFLTIKAQIADKSKEKDIIKYIDSILKDDTKMKYEEYAKFKYLPANGIKGLCYYKVQEAINKKIKVCINISSRIEKSILSKLSIDEIKELGKILGVFLDNAIEASSISEGKVLGFEAYLIDNNVKIIISNSYDNKIDTNKIGKEKYTTKGKNRGHGLLLVKNIVNNNANRFETKTEVTDKLYIQNIIIKKSTEN